MALSVDDDSVRVIGTEQFNSLLQHSVGELSESLRSAFVLYHFAEHLVVAVAEILAATPGTLRKRWHDARQHLQDLFSHDRQTRRLLTRDNATDMGAVFGEKSVNWRR